MQLQVEIAEAEVVPEASGWACWHTELQRAMPERGLLA